MRRTSPRSQVTVSSSGFLERWAPDRTILGNAGSIVGAGVVTSALGFAYWWVAARAFPAEAVGLASAATSAMLLLAGVSLLGLETLLLGDIRREPSAAPSLIATGLLGAGVAGLGFGVLFALLLPFLSAELRPLGASIGSVALFAAGVSLTAIARVLDGAFVGLLRGAFQLWRNVTHSLVKLVLIAGAGYVIGSSKSGVLILGTWVLGTLASVAFLAFLPRLLPLPRAPWRPRMALLMQVTRTALGHHALNLALAAPLLVLPIIVTVQLSAVAAAYFYAALMTATFIFLIPASLTTVLYAISNPQPRILAAKLRHTLAISAVFATVGTGILLVSASFILHLFGGTYAEEATSSLRILALAVFPLVIRLHYVAINRVRRRLGRTATIFALAGIAEIVAASAGAAANGLVGLSLAWLIALSVEALIMVPTVARALRTSTSAPGGADLGLGTERAL